MFAHRSLFALALTAILAGVVCPAGSTQDRTIPAVWTAGEVRGWVFGIDETEFANTWIRYVGVDEGACLFDLRLDMRSSEIGRPGDYRVAARYACRPDGRPLRLHLLASRAQGIADIALSFAGQEVVGRLLAGPSGKEGTVQRMTAPAEAGALPIMNNVVGFFDILLSIAAPAADEKIERRLFSIDNLKGLDYSIEAAGGEEIDGIAYRVATDSLGQRLLLDETGRIRRIRGGPLSIELDDAAWPEWTIEPPTEGSPAPDPVEGVRHLEVRFESAGAELAATLSVPESVEGRLPVVVFVSGSGPQDRRARAAGIDLGTRQILDRLAHRVAVFQYDDRGTGESEGMFAGADLDLLVADAAAAVAAARARPEVDPDQVIVLGHSEGGLIAPILAADDERIAAIALMAGPGRPIDALILEQVRYLLGLRGTPDEEIERTLAEQEAVFDRLRAGEDVPNSEWMADHVRHDPLATIRRVRCPIGIFQGEADYQVSCERDGKALLAALQDAGHPDVEFHSFAGLDHLFKKIAGERSTPEEYAVERPIDEGFLETLEDWIARHAS